MHPLSFGEIADQECVGNLVKGKHYILKFSFIKKAYDDHRELGQQLELLD
jgi:hypothetical protein